MQTTLAADAHLAEGQFLNGEQTLNRAKSLIYNNNNNKIVGGTDTQTTR
jgi:hypothetical protein